MCRRTDMTIVCYPCVTRALYVHRQMTNLPSTFIALLHLYILKLLLCINTWEFLMFFRLYLSCNNISCNNISCNNISCNNISCNNISCNNVRNKLLVILPWSRKHISPRWYVLLILTAPLVQLYSYLNIHLNI